MSLVMNYCYCRCPNSSLSSSYSLPSSSPTFLKCGIHHHHPHPHQRPLTSRISCSLRRHHRRRPRPTPTPEKPHQYKPSSPSDHQKLQMVIDVDSLSNEASFFVKRLWSASRLRFNQFVISGSEALEDLQTLIAVDANRRVILSCRPSTFQFMGSLILWSCVIVFALRFLVKLGLGFWGRLGFGNSSGLILRRDRSLGGREVVVGRRSSTNSNIKAHKGPLSPAVGTVVGASEAAPKNSVKRVEVKRKLPSWWPVLLPPPAATVDKQAYQRVANRLIRAILDLRISGRDISEDDIIQFRRLCRTSGAKVFVDTTNARDSFYRAAVEFVLNICGRAENQSTSVHIDGEGAQQFIAGLADNIGIENTRAARIVSAAVAARTRSCILQAWALEMQGKHSEAAEELSKICLIHLIFPPEECSPEMDMVARGLEKHLKLEQRGFLMDMIAGVCSNGSCRSMAEALGLVPSPDGVWDQQGGKFNMGNSVTQ